MSRDATESLLATLGQQVGIAELQLDDAGCCVLSFDGIVVNFEADEQSRRLFLYADIGEAPDSLPEGLYRDLLVANLLWKGTGGATLALDSSRRRFVLAHGLPADRISDIDFVTTVERFVDIAEAWSRRLTEIGSQPGTAVEPLPANLIHPGMFA